MNLEKNVSLFLSTFLKRFRFLFRFKQTFSNICVKFTINRHAIYKVFRAFYWSKSVIRKKNHIIIEKPIIPLFYFEIQK